MDSKKIHKAQDILTRLSIAYIEMIEKKLSKGDKANLKQLIEKSQEITYVDLLLSDVESELLILQSELEETRAKNQQQQRLIEALRKNQIKNF